MHVLLQAPYENIIREEKSPPKKKAEEIKRTIWILGRGIRYIFLFNLSEWIVSSTLLQDAFVSK